MYTSTGQPQHATGVPTRPPTVASRWSTGLCDCGKDCSSCCLTCCCPCITFGRIGEIVDKGTTSCGIHGALYLLLSLLPPGIFGWTWIYSCMFRSKLRQQYMLPEQPCNDCLVHCCCEWCALCQEYRELKYRGFEPSLGWEGNLARQNQGVVMPPIGPTNMKR